MKINIKKLHPDAIIPIYADSGAAGMDLTCISSDISSDYIEYGTGLAFEIPDGFVGLVFPRSSISKMCHSLANSVGVIDSSYRGEVKLRMRYETKKNNFYKIGDRVGQIMIMPYPKIEFVESDILSSTGRGTGGFGSTGAK